MAIAHDNTTPGTAGIASSLTFSHTTGSGSKRFLVVAVAYQDATSVTGITYNSVALTKVDRAVNGVSIGSELWYLANPDSGANNVVITMSGATAYITGTASTYTGVAQTSLTDGTNKATGNDTAPTVNVTTGRNNSWVIDCVAIQTSAGDVTLTVGAGQTQRSNHSNSSQVRQGVSTELTTTAGSVTMSWSLSGTKNWAIVAFAFKEGGIDSTLTMAQGSYTYTGYATALVYGRKIVLAVGTYTLTGYSATLTLFQKWITALKSATSWTNASKNNSTFTNQNKSSTTWTNKPKT